MNTALRLFSALAAGTLFSAGLTVSGMTDPQRVRAASAEMTRRSAFKVRS